MAGRPVFRTVTEGRTELHVPEVQNEKGPGKREGSVFYNPTMEFNRDINVSLASVLFDEPVEMLDGLAATGARGLRLANEVRDKDGGPLLWVTCNDHSSEVVAVIRENVRANHLDNVIVTNERFHSVVAEASYKYIDVDPFGTPVPYLDGALQGLRLPGYLSLTATDTAPLCGSYPATCRRRYGANPRKGREMHESGLRILTGYLARQAAKFDMGIEPVLCYYADHYFRIYTRVRPGAKRADAALAKVGYMQLDDKEGWVQVEPGKNAIGPMWLGRLHDKAVLDRMDPDMQLGTGERLSKYLGLWMDEAGMPPMFYHTDELARLAGSSPPPLNSLLEVLRDAGLTASRTHFSPSGIKTDAGLGQLLELVKAGPR